MDKTLIKKIYQARRKGIVKISVTLDLYDLESDTMVPMWRVVVTFSSGNTQVFEAQRHPEAMELARMLLAPYKHKLVPERKVSGFKPSIFSN